MDNHGGSRMKFSFIRHQEHEKIVTADQRICSPLMSYCDSVSIVPGQLYHQVN